MPTEPSAVPLRARRPALAALLAAAIALLLAACGGGGGGGDGGADPASIVPKSASVYVVGTIRPDGDQKAAVDAIAKKFGVPDPGKRIGDELDKSDDNSKVSFKDDIEPWLGDRVAVAVTGVGAGEAQAVVIAPSTDTGKTKDALDKDKAGAREKTYKDISYQVDKDGDANGVVGDFFVVGNENAFKAVVDADNAGEGLADTEQFKSAAGKNEGKLGFGFIDLKGLLTALNASGQIDPGASAALRQALGGGELQPVTFGLSARPNSITVDAEAQANRALPAQEAPASVKDLPGDSWVAFGLPDLGKSLTQAIGQFGSGLGGQAVDQIKGQFRQQTGLDLDKDVLAALGDTAFFVRGTSPLDVGGGLVIDTPDPAAANRLVSKLGPLLARVGRSNGVKTAPASVAGAKGISISAPGLPGRVNAVVKGSQLVIAYSDAATTEALAPREKLGDSADYKTATESLGGAAPAFYVAFAPIVELVQSTGSDSAAQVKQYLGALTTLAIGGKTEGNRSTAKFVLGLK